MILPRQPTTREIIAELDSPTGEIDFCIAHTRTGNRRVKPAEIFIDALGTWLRCDGSYGSFALNGTRRFGIIAAFRIRRAVKRWEAKQ